ncbi:MAG: hypothetical protein AAF805_01335 [Planctomycetota bacterium]
MDREPITLPGLPRERVAAPDRAPQAAAIDEALATAGETDFRVHDPHRDAVSAASPPIAAGLASELREQLRALDAQRGHLARLLEGLAG